MNTVVTKPQALRPLALDDIDARIVALLREDGRASCRAIGRELGLSEARVRARIRRLEDSDTLRVVAVTDTAAAGFDMLLAIGVQVEGRAPEAVAQELAALPEVFSVNLAVGGQDIECLAVAQDHVALSALLTQRLAGIEGVSRLTPALAVDVLKNQPDWVPFHDLPAA